MNRGPTRLSISCSRRNVSIAHIWVEGAGCCFSDVSFQELERDGGTLQPDGCETCRGRCGDFLFLQLHLRIGLAFSSTLAVRRAWRDNTLVTLLELNAASTAVAAFVEAGVYVTQKFYLRAHEKIIETLFVFSRVVAALASPIDQLRHQSRVSTCLTNSKPLCDHQFWLHLIILLSVFPSCSVLFRLCTCSVLRFVF